MRWSEPITIYLAAGASFGVNRYQLVLCERRATGLRALMEGVAALLLWPLAMAAILFKRLRRLEESEARHESHEKASARIEDGRRTLVNSVNRMLEVVRRWTPAEREEMERTLYALRESAEQYAGLALVKDEEGSAPFKHEMELARISGRRGEDLLIAGRCAHRRNRARTVARFERERSRLLRALSLIRTQEWDHSASSGDVQIVERMRAAEARLQIYARAFALFSLLEDKDAARSSAELLDAESARLQALKNENEETHGASAVGEERCTEQSPQPIYKGRRMETTLTQG